MHVGVTKAGHDHAALQLDHLSLRTDPLLGLAIGTHQNQLATHNRQGLGPTTGGVHATDAPVSQDDIRGGMAPGRQGQAKQQ